MKRPAAVIATYLLLLFTIVIAIVACGQPTSPPPPLASTVGATGSIPGATSNALGGTEIAAQSAASQLAVALASPSPLVIQIESTVSSTSSQVAIATLTLVPPGAVPLDQLPIDEAAEPVIFTAIGLDQRCGRGDVVAYDGHTLRATPRLTHDNSNFLELLPEGAEVDLIDCRLWTDADGLSWLAVRTQQHKLGWMHIQPDKLYVTLFPIPRELPRALTGIPAGTTIAYVPPSECRDGPVSTESTATSIGVDLIPVVGDLKGLGEAATGCDMVTGEPLGNWRWFGLLGLVGLSEVALLRHADEASSVARVSDDLAGSLRYSDEAAIAAARNADTAADFIRRLDAAGAASASADAARAAERGVGFTDETVQALARVEQPCSFAAGTLVQTAAGPLPIETLRPGMLVMAYDEQRSRAGLFPITAVMAHIDTSLLILRAGRDTLLTTPDHPFLSLEGWQPAGELAAGEQLRTIDGRRWAIGGAVRVEEPRLMFNLTVAEAHTYAVGSDGWVVHNACSRVLRRNIGAPSWADEATEWQAHHIIPGEFEDHPFVIRASDSGWNIDAADNGIALPKWEADADRLGLPAHRGYHRHYSADVGDRLDTLEQRALAENWTDARAQSELRRLIVNLRTELLRSSGQRLPY